MIEDRNHYLKSITFLPEEASSLIVVNKERASNGWGQQPHSDLGYNAYKNCQYPKDHCLYFRISVDAQRSSMPWLV